MLHAPWEGRSWRRAAVLTLVAVSLSLAQLAVPAAAAPRPASIALAWGANGAGQLGDGTTTSSSVPVRVRLPVGITITAISAGGDYSLALASDGRVLAWGYNDYGQLGDGTTTGSSVPVRVRLPVGITITAISAGAYDSLALASDGRVFAWGDNHYGQLGDGTTTRSTVPVQVHLPAGTTVTAVAAGFRHSLALASDGRLLAWGYNYYGQLGDGTTTDSSVPVPVHLPAGATVTAIAAGSFHSVALAAESATIATVTASPARARHGNPVTLTATVRCTVGTPAGTVTFTDRHRAVIGTARLGADGTATLTTRTLRDGKHAITARYSGSRACPRSTSRAVTVTITPAPRPALPRVPVTG